MTNSIKIDNKLVILAIETFIASFVNVSYQHIIPPFVIHNNSRDNVNKEYSQPELVILTK